MSQENYCRCCDRNRDEERQEHVHEIAGYTAVSEEYTDCHSHRFAAVSGEAIRHCDSHVHEVKFRTDFADGHYHEFCGTSSAAIDVGNGKHVHYATGYTDDNNCHNHRFQLVTLMESPTEFECERENDWKKYERKNR